MHALTVEEEPQEGMTPGEVNDREYMARVRFAWSKCNRMICLLQLQDLVIHCLVGNPSWVRAILVRLSSLSILLAISSSHPS